MQEKQEKSFPRFCVWWPWLPCDKPAHMRDSIECVHCNGPENVLELPDDLESFGEDLAKRQHILEDLQGKYLVALMRQGCGGAILRDMLLSLSRRIRDMGLLSQRLVDGMGGVDNRE